MCKRIEWESIYGKRNITLIIIRIIGLNEFIKMLKKNNFNVLILQNPEFAILRTLALKRKKFKKKLVSHSFCDHRRPVL